MELFKAIAEQSIRIIQEIEGVAEKQPILIIPISLFLILIGKAIYRLFGNTIKKIQ